LDKISGAFGNGANTGIALTLAATNNRPFCFLSGGDRTLRLWWINSEKKKLGFVEVNFNKNKRIINCLTVSLDYYTYMLDSGDFAQVKIID